MLNAQLTHCIGLNDLCDCLQLHTGPLSTIRGATAPSRNGLSHANRKRPPEIAEKLFWRALDHLTQQTPGFATGKRRGPAFRFKMPFHVIASTVMELVANCLDWARHRRRKAAAKTHMRLNLQSLLPSFVIVDTAAEHDNKRVRELCADLKSGEIILFDKGYVDFAHLRDLDLRGIFWVTRAKENMVYEVVGRMPPSKDGKILRGEVIVLTNQNTPAPELMRRVVALVEIDGEEREMTFLTNNLAWSPRSVADLYRCRWQIEVVPCWAFRFFAAIALQPPRPCALRLLLSYFLRVFWRESCLNGSRYKMVLNPTTFPLRPAWTEIDLGRLRRNVQLIRRDLPSAVKLLAVVKDEAYGHGAQDVARIALQEGASAFGLSSLEEAMALRDAGITAPLLLLGERQEAELPWCVEHNLTVCVNDANTARQLARAAAAAGKRAPVHVKIHTGMSRYGVRWDEALPLLKFIGAERSLVLEGAMTHFAQSDETDKSFGCLQISRFDDVMRGLAESGGSLPCQHLCNSGGFLDLPQAHRDMVRVGILLYGVFPSTVCRRIPGIEPVMSVKARIAGIQRLEPGEVAGYGMRYTATARRRIAVLPIGYGDGFPRVRNQGAALIHGQRAPIVGGIAMDALMVDITDIPQAQMWDEAVLMGRQGREEISVHDIAKLKNTVSYDVLTGWRLRLRRKCVNGEPRPPLAHATAHVVQEAVAAK